jgi:Tol biopolymer transport system component
MPLQIVYQTDETGADQVYVKPLSGTGRGVQVSSNVGFDPRWSQDGRRVFFWGRADAETDESTLMVVEVENGDRGGLEVELLRGRADEQVRLVLRRLTRPGSLRARTAG